MKKFELSIPKPCHENWDAMTPEDRGRFCGLCQKTVIDFTDMSDRQVADFFKRPVGSVCGRFGGDQLNRIIEMPRKRIPWVKYFFTIALPAFLLSKKAAAQGEVRVKTKVTVCEKPALKGDTLIKPLKVITPPEINNIPIQLGMVRHIPVQQTKQDSLTIISGRVIDENGNPVPYASIQLPNTQQGTMTDSLGRFSIKTNQTKGILQVSSVGFTMLEKNYEGQSPLTIVMEAQMMGEVVVVGAVIRKPPKNIPVISPPKNDLALSKFSVFPNPVEHNSVFTIEVRDMEDGRYNLAIITSAGEIVQTKELIMENKLKRFTIRLENIAAAPYFIRLTNQANNKAYTEIILVK